MFPVSVECDKKIAWFAVCAGWIFLLIRILMIILKLG